MRTLKFLSLIAGSVSLTLIAGMTASCIKNGPDVKPAPVITFDNPTGIYTVKAGKTLTVEPVVENDLGAGYSWTTSEGELLGSEKALVHSWNESGQVYITFRVSTKYGSDEKEIRVDVAALVPPRISLAVPEGGYVILKGQALTLAPEVDGEEAAYKWSVGGEEVAATKDYIFLSGDVGTYHVSFEAANGDGEDRIEFDVSVVEQSDMAFSWLFESTVYSVSKGRTIRLLPYAITNAFEAEYIWKIDGAEVQRSPDPLYAFYAEAEGVYPVSVTMKNTHYEFSRELTVNVCPAEGRYERPANASSGADWNKVYEFLAAPGQFVNENYTAATMDEAAGYAEGRLKESKYVSLGGFGGYIVLGFDHSIDNDGGYNFQVMGNSFQGSSEPGIVWVMQDENGDGLPNDTWYELKGSEYGKPETVQDYEVTYYRPSAAGMPVSWTDNLGGRGSVDYLAAFHRQDFYYPLWVEADSYILRGTRLESRTHEVTPGYWSNDEFEWGYADNFSPVDRLTDDDNYSANVNANHFRISDAVTFDGSPANLRYVDFIKIQTGVNAKAGWLGENSTEVFGARDFNIVKNTRE